MIVQNERTMTTPEMLYYTFTSYKMVYFVYQMTQRRFSYKLKLPALLLLCLGLQQLLVAS